MLYRDRLVRRLSLPADVTVISGIVASGGKTLIRQWADGSDADDLRVVVTRGGGRARDEFAWALTALAEKLEHTSTAVHGQLPLDGLRSFDPARRLEAFGAVASSIDMMISFAFLDLDETDPIDFLAGYEDLRRVAPRVRVLGAITDERAMVAAARVAGLSVENIDDTERIFSPSEVDDYARQVLGSLDDRALAHLISGTGGHPALVDLAVSELGEECRRGLLSRSAVLAAWRAPFIDACADVPAYRLIGYGALSPWITDALAAELLDGRDASFEVDRMVAYGLGRRERRTGSVIPVFRWDSSWREWLLASGRVIVDSDARRLFSLKLASAARAAGEYGLEVWSLALAGESARAEQCIRANLWEILDAAEQGDWSLVDRVGEAEQPSLVDTLRWSVELTQRPGDESTARRTRDAARSLASARWSDPLHRICDLALATHALLLAGQSDEAADLWERNLELCVQLREQPEQAIGSAPFRALPVIQQAFVLGSLGRLRRAHNELRQTLRDWREGGEAHRDARLARDALLISARFRKLFGEPLTHAERESVEHFIPGAAYMGTLNLAAVRAWEQLDADALVTAVSVAERREHEGAACVMVHFVRAVVGPAALSDDERSALRDPLAAHSFDGRAMARRATSWVESLATMDVAPLDEPRIRQAVHLARAIRAHRAGRPAYALSLLERAHEKRGGALAPIPLILCAKSERRALVHLASDAGNLTLATYLAVSSDWVDPTAGRDAEAPSLTRREGELLEMLRENKTVREIAEQSHLSVSTVKFHRANLYRKLGATSRDDALARTVLLFGER